MESLPVGAALVRFGHRRGGIPPSVYRRGTGSAHAVCQARPGEQAMTTTLIRHTHVRRGRDGLIAQCSGCDLALQQVDGFDRDVALGTLLQYHPASPDAVHRPTIPAGWRKAA
jgi:hypothetical protein